MGKLYLVRHGQASFGAADYDRLSSLGWKQSVRLGDFFREHGLTFQSVISGTLRRHIQTFEGIVQGMGSPMERLEMPELDEYDSAALIDALHAPPLPDPHSPDGYRQHFRYLRAALQQWTAGVISPRGMPTYPDFVQGVETAINLARIHTGGNVLIVSSGGPISTAVGQLLGASSETIIELSLRMRNTSVTEVAITPKRLSLVTFNGLPHLSQPDHQDWITHA